MAFADGWLVGEQPFSWQVDPSPHFNARPPGVAIDLLVIHNISLPPGQFNTGCIEDFFCGRLDTERHPWFENIREVRVSAHFLIKRSGQLVQFVSCADRAWHAGDSSFEGRVGCNDYSLGIELEGTDHTPYAPQQYTTLCELVPLIQQEYPAITRERICGHQHIAPQRKTDPGPSFDWGYFFSHLK